MRKFIGILFGVILIISASVAGASPAPVKTFESEWGIIYEVSFDNETEVVTVTAINPTSKTLPLTFSVWIDEHSQSISTKIAPAREQSFKFDLTEAVNLVRDVHTVSIHSGRSHVSFTYTRNIVPVSSENYPAPTITDVELRAGEYQGEQVTIVNVVAENPTARFWTLIVLANTLETNGNYGIAQLEPYGNGHATIILNETPGERIAGEIRMYSRNFSRKDHAFDQIEIYGRTGEGVYWNHEKYVVVRAPWHRNPYTYQNKSAVRERTDHPDTIWQSPVIWVASVLLALGTLSILRKIRS